MYCNRCRKEAAPGDAFCRSCGAALEAVGGEGETRDRPAPKPLVPPAPMPPPGPAAGKEISVMAVASLILAVAAFIFIPVVGSVLGIVFGIIARSEISRRGGDIEGSGMALAGIVLGALGLLAAAVFAVMLAVFLA